MSRMRASKASSRLPSRPLAVEARGHPDAGVRARVALEQVEDRAAEDQRVAARGREGRAVALAQPGDHRGAVERGLAGEVLGGALDQPGPAQVGDEAARRPHRRQRRVVGGEHDLRVQPLGGAAQGAQRVLAGGAPLHPGVVEGVDLARHRPARQVAARRRRRRPAHGGQERVGRGEPGRVGVEDHGDAARHLLEAVLEPQPQVLERSSMRCAQARSASSWRAVKLSESVSIQVMWTRRRGVCRRCCGRRTPGYSRARARSRSSSSSVRTPIAVEGVVRLLEAGGGGDRGRQRNCRAGAAASGSKKKVRAPSGVSSHGPPAAADGNWPALAAAQRTAFRLASVGRPPRPPRSTSSQASRRQSPGAEQRAGGLQAGDPLQHLVRGQLAVAAGPVDRADRRVGRLRREPTPAASTTASQSGLASPARRRGRARRRRRRAARRVAAELGGGLGDPGGERPRARR